MNAQITPAQRSALKLTTVVDLDRAGMHDADKIVEQMADDCRVFAANAESVTAEDLEVIGWSPAQIAKHGRAAARRAYARAAAAREYSRKAG